MIEDGEFLGLAARGGDNRMGNGLCQAKEAAGPTGPRRRRTIRRRRAKPPINEKYAVISFF
jgi:hypothetical protein